MGAKRGTRPSAPRDQRTASAYIFGAICPKHGKGAALVLPRCDTEAMNLHLAEIATQIAPGAHAALIVDQAGWHLSGGLIVPPNITLIPFPAKCPELNPQENVWQFMRDNWLSNRSFKSFDDIVDHFGITPIFGYLPALLPKTFSVRSSPETHTPTALYEVI